MNNGKKQTAVEWLEELYNNRPAYEEFISYEEFEQAKEMEREQIAEAFTKGNRLDFYDATETIGEKYSKELCGCTSTSSATKCKFCGKEKWQHISGRI